jgi:N-acetylmuramoyl-L-alanine amidase
VLIHATRFRLGWRLVIGVAAAAVLATAAARVSAAEDAAAFPVATDARLAGDDTQTRFVLDLSRKVELHAFTLADPYRVVVDLPQITFQLRPKAGESGRGLVKAFRYGLVMQGGSRIVLDVGRPVRIGNAFMLDAADGQPARLVLDLTPVDRDTFMRALMLDRAAQRAEAPAAAPEPAAAGDPRPLIMIDPGHGGIDNGTRAASGETEKSIVLEFALLLRDKLEKTGKFRTVLTRTDDTYVPLNERVRQARAQQAALFISIHADALPASQGEAQGATVYTLSDTASDAEAARLAEAENKADVIAGVDLTAEPDDVTEILIDLAQRETKSFSTQFARTLVHELKTTARLHKNPLKSAGFRVLKSPDVPSVLVELGYVSNKQDLKLLTSSEWRTRTAAVIAQATEAFFTKRGVGSGLVAGSN